VEELLVRFGPPAVLLGAALEGDASVLIAGVMAHLGFLSLPQAIALGALGGWLSDCAWYALGRRGGATLRRSASFARIGAFIERLAARLGPWEIVPARFVYGTRIPSMLFWGVNRLPFARFATIAALACVAWSVVFASLGFVLSDRAAAILGEVKRIELWLAGAVVLAAVVVLVLRALGPKAVSDR
jgi:membrane protein DedA with SNARE-associated domain